MYAKTPIFAQNQCFAVRMRVSRHNHLFHITSIQSHGLVLLCTAPPKFFISHPAGRQRITAVSPSKAFRTGSRMARRQGEAEEMVRPRRLNAVPSGLACLDVRSPSVYLIFWLELVLRLEPPKNASWGQHEVVRQILKVQGHEDRCWIC